jgi:hypothetical protein
LSAGLVVAVSDAVVFGFVVPGDGVTVFVVVAGLFVAEGADVPGAAFEPALFELPDVGVVDVAGAAGSVVSGVGSGGKGLVITAAISSFRPASDWL